MAGSPRHCGQQKPGLCTVLQQVGALEQGQCLRFKAPFHLTRTAGPLSWGSAPGLTGGPKAILGSLKVEKGDRWVSQREMWLRKKGPETESAGLKMEEGGCESRKQIFPRASSKGWPPELREATEWVAGKLLTHRTLRGAPNLRNLLQQQQQPMHPEGPAGPQRTFQSCCSL